ncbi:hypothetical protein F4804DRAFT_312292 [Jackrogersella minutella]|nr:hypothetical protein F4804DRAFT_312292 [Jackrogersella minutella]
MPGRTTSSVAATSVRRGPREPSRATVSRPPHQLAGCILWLPRKEDIRGRCEDVDSDLEEDRCNHPVVVLSPQVEDGKVVYLMMTSLGGKDLMRRFREPKARLEHLPIRPCKAHPDNNILLSLEDVTQVLRKKSYVKTNKPHCITLSSLHSYNRSGPEPVLSRKSYHELIQYAKFSPPTPHPSSNTVSSPGRVRWPEQAIPITRERRGSYGEYVSALRGLEVGGASPPRVQNVPVTTSTNPVRYTRPAVRSEQAPLLPPPNRYSRYPYASPPGSYPSSYTGGHPLYVPRPSGRAGYGSPESPDIPNRATLWRRFKRLLWVVIALGGAYLAYRGLYWLIGAVKGTGSLIRGRVDDIGSKIARNWSILGEFVEPLTYYTKRHPPRA